MKTKYCGVVSIFAFLMISCLSATAWSQELEMRTSASAPVRGDLTVGDRETSDKWIIERVGSFARIRRSAGIAYLSYKLEKGESTVLVKDKPDKGSLWKLTPKGDPSLPKYIIQAANGGFEGWYLQVSSVPLEATNRRSHKIELRQLELQQQPKQPEVWQFVEIAK